MSVRSTRWLTGIDIGTWRVLAPLGSGHSGEVYRVRETVPPFRPAALKLFRSTDFLCEADLVAAQPIPGYMPRLFARGSFEGAPYFVMELAERLPDNLSASTSSP